MKITSNNYKNYLLKKLLKSNKVLIFCGYPLCNDSSKLELEQDLKKNGSTFYLLKNRITNVFIEKTIFSLLSKTICGTVAVVGVDKSDSFDYITKKFPVFALKISNKLYVPKQASGLHSYNYLTKIKSLNNNLLALTKKISININKIK